MSSDQLTAMNGYVAENYPGVYRTAYRRTSVPFSRTPVSKRQREILLEVLNIEPAAFAGACNAVFN